MKQRLLFITALCLSGQLVAQNHSPEVIYHVFQRSFYDSNGDGQGDLPGLTEKLGELQDLGATSLQLLPLYQSSFYHNYFASDFKKIDPRFGTTEDFLTLVKEAHRRGMKIYLDMETQYVTEDHPWFKESLNNPSSPYTHYLVYNGPGNTQPETIIFNLTELTGYNGTKKKVTTVNLLDADVLKYNVDLFHYFMDPNGDGKFEDGVDGFRLDHMMDDLDWKGKFKDLFKKFWTPLLSQLKAINPKIKIVAEQANWGSWGQEYFRDAGVDRVFAFRLMGGIASFDKKKLSDAVDSTYLMTPFGHDQVVFIENHDMQRFSSLVHGDPGKLRVGAALNILVGRVPAIYYGQELGMFGAGGFGKFGNTDGNDIPMREAYEWYASDEGKGMALWYKNTGPWWDQTNLKPNDGISLEEEKGNPNSLYTYYKKLLAIRKAHHSLSLGDYKQASTDGDKVFAFTRTAVGDKTLVVVNLSDKDVTVNIDLPATTHATALLGKSGEFDFSDSMKTSLPPYGVEVYQIR